MVKKLSKTEMNTSKQAAAYLISRLVNLVPQAEKQLLEIYSGTVYSDVPAFKIIASKHLVKLLENVRNKEEISKMLEIIYSDNEDLAKMFAL